MLEMVGVSIDIDNILYLFFKIINQNINMFFYNIHIWGDELICTEWMLFILNHQKKFNARRNKLSSRSECLIILWN